MYIALILMESDCRHASYSYQSTQSQKLSKLLILLTNLLTIWLLRFWDPLQSTSIMNKFPKNKLFRRQKRQGKQWPKSLKRPQSILMIRSYQESFSQPTTPMCCLAACLTFSQTKASRLVNTGSRQKATLARRSAFLNPTPGNASLDCK